MSELSNPPPDVTLKLLRGSITLEDALTTDRDIIQDLSYPPKRIDFYLYLYQRRVQISQLVSRHLGIPQTQLTVGEPKEWQHGTYNACIPVHIADSRRYGLPAQVLMRFPLPYRVGDEFRPGNSEEKLRCEAATYLWLQRECPSVPIPKLYGIGFPGAQSFTCLENESLWHRLIWYFRWGTFWLSGLSLPPYFAHQRDNLREVSYLLIEYVAEGKMLSSSWQADSIDPLKRRNFFRDLSKTILAFAKVPLPRIGSWTMDEHGLLSLTNRPLTSHIQEMENHRIPVNMPRDQTYTSIEPYFLDLIDALDSRMRHQRNSIHDLEDGEGQLAALTGLRALLPTFFRGGPPFILTLTDLHQSNILVDDDWHITRFIDLEWACALPLQTLGPPYWITGKAVDHLKDDTGEKWEDVYGEFLTILAEEERISGQDKSLPLCSQMIKEFWDTGRMYYRIALICPEGMWDLYRRFIVSRFDTKDADGEPLSDQILVRMWDPHVEEFLAAKVAQKERYCDKLREMFAAAARKEEKGAVSDSEGKEDNDEEEEKDDEKDEDAGAHGDETVEQEG